MQDIFNLFSVACDMPAVTLGLIINTQYNAEGDVLECSCDMPAYEIVQGDQQRTCLTDGSWSGTPLECGRK